MYLVYVLNTTFNNISVISWRSVLLVEETRVPWVNHWPVTSHWQTLFHNVVSSTVPKMGFEIKTLVVIGTDCTGSYKSNYRYQTITTTTAPKCIWYFVIVNNINTYVETHVNLYHHFVKEPLLNYFPNIKHRAW